MERPPVPRTAYGMDDLAITTGLSKSRLYLYMEEGRLSFLKVGRRRLVTQKALDEFFASFSKQEA